MRINEDSIEAIRRYATDGRVVVFDTETTGCAWYDEICQIAAAEYVCGECTRTFNVYVSPTCEMNPWAEGVHGLSMDFLAEHGLAPEEAMRQFFDFLGNDALLVAHNNKFDMRMLNQECEKFGLCFAPEGIETCDTLALSRHLRPELQCHALANLIDVLGIDGVNSHDALDDAHACAGVFFRLIESLKKGTVAEGLHIAYAEEQKGTSGKAPSRNAVLSQFQRSKGKRQHEKQKVRCVYQLS